MRATFDSGYLFAFIPVDYRTSWKKSKKFAIAAPDAPESRAVKIADRDPAPPQGQPADRRASSSRCSSSGPASRCSSSARPRWSRPRSRAASLLFVLSYLNVTLIAAVLFVLGRTLIKLWLDRRAAGPRLALPDEAARHVHRADRDSRSALVFFTATGLLQRSIDRWFSTPVRQVVQQARAVQDLAERRILERGAATRRRTLAAGARPAPRAADGALEALRRERRLDSVEVYRGGPARAPSPPRIRSRRRCRPRPCGGDGADREPFKIEVLPDGSHRYRAAFVQGDRGLRGRHPDPGLGGARARRDRRGLERLPEARGAEAGDQGGQHLDVPADHARDPLRVDLDGAHARAAHHRARSARSPRPRAGSVPATSRRASTCRPPTSSPCSSSPSTGWPRASRRRATRSCTPTRSSRPPTAGSSSSAASSRPCSSR